MIEGRELKGKDIVLVQYGKIYPPEYYEKRRGRRPSVTSYKIDKTKVSQIKIVTVTMVVTGRESIDMDSKKMATKIYYIDKNGVQGITKLEENPKFILVEDNLYVHSSAMNVLDQIRDKING